MARLFGPTAPLLAIAMSLTGVHSATSQEASAAHDEQIASIRASECGQAPYSILLSVMDVRKAEGLVTADLHNDNPERFLASGRKLARIRVPAVMGETLICIPVEQPGKYAVAVYHDKDADMKFDKTWIGLPDEPFGLTRDPKIRLSKPDVEDVVFDVQGPLTPATATLRRL
jgi:uncharacterized protein (DUF2141 family)